MLNKVPISGLATLGARALSTLAEALVRPTRRRAVAVRERMSFFMVWISWTYVVFRFALSLLIRSDGAP